MKNKFNKQYHLGRRLVSLILIAVLTVSLLPATARETKAAGNLSNPRIVKDSSMEAGQKVTWDCVWFGSYPQAEVITSEMNQNYTALDPRLRKEGDVVVSDDVYHKLKNVTGWNSNNDITIDGKKYRRIKKSDATYAATNNSDSGYYNWSDDSTYHYFQYEPIKWRVLHTDGNQALLLSDQALDNQQYNNTTGSDNVTWETSTIRSWLNGYGPGSNIESIDYSSNNFLSSAFSLAEKGAILTTTVKNENNKTSDTNGGNDTKDQIFFLSESEIYGTEQAITYGFTNDKDVLDEARRSQSSTYAKALGVNNNITRAPYQGNAVWWLRSPGIVSHYMMDVYYDGYVYSIGNSVTHCGHGVRAALNLNLSSNLYSYAGTICSDGTTKTTTSRPSTSSSPTTSVSKPNSPTPTVTKKPIKAKKVSVSGISKKIAAGKKITLKATISPNNVTNKKIRWKSSNTKIATVNSKGVVTIKKKTGGKTVTITATALDGSKKKATYKIKVMKGVVKKVTISGKKTVKAGKTLKLKAKVTASKGANKTMKWTSSNTKYAKVSSSGKVTARKAGKGKKVKITAMATDGSGKKKTVTIKIK